MQPSVSHSTIEFHSPVEWIIVTSARSRIIIRNWYRSLVEKATIQFHQHILLLLAINMMEYVSQVIHDITLLYYIIKENLTFLNYLHLCKSIGSDFELFTLLVLIASHYLQLCEMSMIIYNFKVLAINEDQASVKPGSWELSNNW